MAKAPPPPPPRNAQPPGRKRRGRPSTPDGSARNVNLMIRCRRSVKDALVLSARTNGRSLSSEIEWMLIQSQSPEFLAIRIAILEAELAALRRLNGGS